MRTVEARGCAGERDARRRDARGHDARRRDARAHGCACMRMGGGQQPAWFDWVEQEWAAGGGGLSQSAA